MTAPYLSIHISSLRSQAWLFDDRSGSYQLSGYVNQPGSARDPQTLTNALRALEKISGRRIISKQGKILFSEGEGTEGLERAGITFSAGKPIRTALIGLSEKFSLEPLRRLVSFFNSDIVLELNLQNEPNLSSQIEKLTNTGFDLLILAGGVNGGPEKALRAAISNLRLLCQLRQGERPQIVYAGNQALADHIKLELEIGEDLYIAGNIQPESGREDLSFAYKAVCKVIRRIRIKEFPAMLPMLDNPKVNILPSEYARARIGSWLEQTQPTDKGILQIHLEPEFGQVIATHNGKRMGLWENMAVDEETIETVSSMLGKSVDPVAVATYMLNKQIHPFFLPATLEELSIEITWISVRIKSMLRRLSGIDPDFHYDEELGMQDNYEPVLLSGTSLDRLPSFRHAFIPVLDSVLPNGITTFAWDDFEVTGALGVLADFNSLLSTQIVDNDMFTNMATIVVVDSLATIDQLVLRLEVDEGMGEMRQRYKVYMNELKRIETSPVDNIRVYLSPEENSDVGMGMRGLGGWVSTPTSKLGIIIDARGRPPFLHSDPQIMNKIRQNWLWELGV
jgi:hypothetical protein